MMHRFRLSSIRTGLAAGVLLCAIALPAADALAAAEGGDTLEEIIVTAQKREQNLQSVGTSITAFDGASLQEQNLKDVTDIATQTPGLQFNQYSPTITVYNLRGVSQNDFSDHQEAPVAVYVDDAYVASMGALAGTMYDLERVEILRGPQGTLFGRNATGGLIHYVSKKPSTDVDSYVSVDAGNFQTFNTQGAFNAPFSESVQGRFAFATANHKGYMENTLGPRLNDQKQYSARAQLRIKPSENGEILLNLHGLKNSNEHSGIYSWAASALDPVTGLGYFIGPNDPVNGACGGCDVFGYKNESGDVYKQSEDRIGLFDRETYGFTGHVNWQFDGFQFTSVTDYLHLKKRYGEDSDMGPFPIFNYDTYQTYHQLSQELRLNGDTGPMRWIAGVYYLDYKTDDKALTDFSGIGGIVGGAIFKLKTSSWSGFGQLERDFGSGWTAIAGARYTNDHKNYDFNETDPFAATSVQFNDSHDWSIFTAKLELDRKFTQDVMGYASISRGAKGGGYSAPSTGDFSEVDAATLERLLRFDQEKLTSYELGLKSEFWNKTARLNAAAFYYDYKGYQGFVLQGLTQVVVNLDATVKGAEVEFAVVPVRGLNLELGASYLDAQAKDVPLPSGLLADREMPQAPKLSLNASMRYEWPALNGNLSFEVDGKWSDKQYLELVNAPVDLQKSYGVVNAKVGYAGGDGNWDVYASVRNLGDERYRVYNLDLSVLGFNQGVYAPPRLYGLGFNYRWGK